jgi:hypothetical protein
MYTSQKKKRFQGGEGGKGLFVAMASNSQSKENHNNI